MPEKVVYVYGVLICPICSEESMLTAEYSEKLNEIIEETINELYCIDYESAT